MAGKAGRCDGLEMFLETVEDAGPAFEMAVATFFAGESLVSENEQSIIPAGLEFDGDQRFVGFEFAEIGSASVFFPGPGEDEPFGRFDFAIGAGGGEVFTVRLSGLDAVSAANAWIAFGGGDRDFAGFPARDEPLLDLFGIGPRFEDTFARSFDEAFEFQ